MRKKMQRDTRVFRANLQTDHLKRQVYEGKEYLVAPCIALVPGILNGELVPLSAVMMTAQAWDGKPVVLGHPYDLTGMPVKANQRDILQNMGMGSLWDTAIVDDKLHVQVWLDLAKIEQIGGDALVVLNKIRNREPVEVSTGYLAVMSNKRGVYGDRRYDAVTDVIIPDHLALLANELGACSWATGCGIPRTMEAREMDTGVVDEKTIGQAIADFLRKKFSSEEPVPDNTVVVRHEIKQHGSCSCGSVKAHAEEDPPAPTPPMPVPEETGVPKPEPVPEPAPEPVEPDAPKENTEEESEEESEAKPKESEGTVDTVDTLQAFCEEHGVTEDELLVTVQARANWRKTMISIIKANSSLTDKQLQNVLDPVLETMASSYEGVTQEERVPQVTTSIYALRGAPVSQTTEAPAKKLARRKPLLEKAS
jgi:hypothetical protein